MTAGHMGYLKYQEKQHISYWASQEAPPEQSPVRSPSALLDFDPDSLEVYRDFFDFESFQKYLDYKLSLKIYSNQPKEQDAVILKTLKESINETLIQKNAGHKTEGIESHDKGLLSLIEGNLFTDLAYEFKKRLKKKGFPKGLYQINFNFTPHTHSEFTYNDQLGSNNLIDWSKKGSLVKSMNKLPKTFEEKIVFTPVPASSDSYQYKGGQITLWLDMDADPKGFIRVRRYFRASELANSDAHIQDETFRVNLVHFKSLNKKNKHGNSENFVTVDLYKKFEGENGKPELDRIELHFGKVLPQRFESKDLSRGLASYSNSVLETSELNIYGVLNYHSKEHIFMTKVEKLVFDFKSGEFSSKSKLKTSFKSEELKGTHLGSAQFKISQKLLDDYGIKLIESFKLGEIHSKFGGKRK